MAIDIGLRIMQLLDSIGIKGGSYLGKASNVKKAFTGGKPTFFKPDVLETLRSQDGNFSDALKLIEEESVYIANATDVEKMAFLNNLMEYKSLGGPQKTKSGITALDQAKNLTDEAGDLKTSIEDLQGLAKSMKDEAEAGKNKALKDLDDFFETGGQPLKKKDDKYLGGSMHEEGQIRTGVRQFLQNEYKNGKINLDETDKFRVMQYSPMTEDDPIKVFKKIYGDEAYKKAGSFPGAFEIGENYKHYEEIFRKNMGEDLLKVKDKKYVGDGKLVLTEMEEIKTPIDDDDIPFAEGGRASFSLGGPPKMVKGVMEIIKMIKTKMSPMGAMKEVNKVIGRKGEYSRLTQKDIDQIVEETNDFIFQRDPDDLYVGGKDINKPVDDMSLEETLETAEGLGATKMAERFKLKQKYPGLDDDMLTNIIEDTDPVHKASVLAKIDMAMELGKTNKSAEEIIDILKKEPETKMAAGGRAGYYGGGQAMVEPDLSDIGHGSDALMARNRLVSPGSQATTSTGLNYLLGEDNDNVRVPFNEGLLVPKPKPYTEEMFQDDSMTLLKGMYGTGPESNTFLYNKMIEKGNMLRKQGVERETVIEIIRNNKDKIDMILKQQTTSPKSLAGLADGGRIGYATKGKVDLADLASIKELKKARSENEEGIGGVRKMGRPSAARRQRNKILDNAIAKLTYAVDNLDQETREKVISAFNDQLQIGYETTMSGLKMDAADKVGIVPIDKETIYKAIVNMDLPKETKLKIETLSNMAGDEELAFSLINNNLGITYDNQSQTIVGKYKIDSKDGKLSITPSITKNEDSQIQSKIEIDKAIEGGKINLDVEKDTTDNSLTTDFSLVKDGNFLSAKNVSGTDNNYFQAEGTAEIPAYMLKDGSMPSISAEYYKDKGDNLSNYQISSQFPINSNLVADISNTINSNNTSNTELGLTYNKFVKNPFKKDQSNSSGIFSVDARMDDDNNKNLFANISFPLGKNTTNNIGNMNFDEGYLSRDEKEKREREKLENTMLYNGKAYKKNNIYSGNELSELIKATTDNFNLSDFIGPKQELALGGIAGLRQGYSKGKGVDLARRGFLKVLGATAAGVAAFKTGALKLLGKTAKTKVAPKFFTAEAGSGAPAWFEGMVNKVLADGVDITKKAATMDGQTVKSLDTPTGKVDVTIDRTGNVDVSYIGDNTAMGEGVDMRYVVNEGDEFTRGKPMDEFEAVESIPEGQMSSPNDYNVEFAENATDNVKNLYSDTSELAELGGQKPLIKDISTTIKKKQTLKKMNENPDQFASDNLRDDFPNYDYDDVNPDYD